MAKKRPTAKQYIVVFALFLAVFFAFKACSTSGVDWSKYSPGVKARIDQMAATRDCAGLQAEFNTADSNNAAQRARTGSNNADLMEYIDNKMKDADC